MHYLCEEILSFEKHFSITENAEFAAVGLQTSIISREREKAEQKQIQHNLTHQSTKKHQKEHLGLLPP